MNVNWQDIFKLIKTALMTVIVVLCLAGCSSSNGNSTGADLKDEQQEELDEQQRSCWQGAMLAQFYNLMGKSALKAYPHVTKTALPFIMAAFAVWLSIRVLKHVSSVMEETSAEVWTEVGRMAVMCLFCGLLASSTDFLLYALNTFVFPIYYAFLEFGSEVLALAAGDSSSKGQMLGETCLIYTNENMVCKAPSLTPITSGGEDSFPSGPSDMMQCLVCTTSDRMQIGFVIAKNLLSQLSISSFFAGIIIYVIFIFVKISFVFYMVDSIFRMTIIIIILPFLILAIPFKATRKWSKQGFETIINSSATMMCIAIIITMAIIAMQMVLQDNTEELGDKGKYQEFSIVMLSMVLIAFLVLKSIGLAVSLAGSIVGGGGGTNFQKKIGKLAAWVAKKVAAVVSAGAGKVFTSVIDRVEKLREIKEKSDKARAQVSNAINKLAGRDKAANGEE